VNKSRKIVSSLIALAISTAAVGAAWGGITAGRLNDNDVEVDLSSDASYDGSNAINPITLEAGKNSITLTNNVILGDRNVTGYAADATEMATDTDAKGAIFIKDGQTLTIRPNRSLHKKVSGKSSGNQSSLRLFGNGTTNLYAGDANSFSVTFLQNGRLNLDSKEALGGSDLTLGGGATLGLADNVSSLDLKGVNLSVRRYSAESKATIDTGKGSITIDGLSQRTSPNASQSGGNDITLVKTGSGALTISGVANHSGGTFVESGALLLGMVPSIAQTIEVNSGAALSSSVKMLANVTVKPHAGSTLAVPAASLAAAQIQDAGEAALSVSAIDPSALASLAFTIKANLDALKRPEGTEADFYYVKLLHSAPNALSEKNVKLDCTVPAGFAAHSYVARAYVDGQNVYAVLSKDLQATANVFDVTLYKDSNAKNVINVVVKNKSKGSFPSGTNFTYSFIDRSGRPLQGSDTVRDDTVFWAKNVEFNKSGTSARFQIDLNKLIDGDGKSRKLSPDGLYEIKVDGTGSSSKGAGFSDLFLNGNGNFTQPPASDSYSVTVSVSADVRAGLIKADVNVASGGVPSRDGTAVNFQLCDTFGEPVKISGVQTSWSRQTKNGFATSTFEKIPAGRYLVRISSPEFLAVRFSDGIAINGRSNGGDGGGCDSGLGMFAFSALFMALAMRPKGARRELP
jgi:autotransporter-associated beta strand protein